MKRLTAVLTLSVVTVLAACGGDKATTPTPASVAGTWSLQTVDGTSLPFVLTQTSTNEIDLSSQVIVASSTGSFTQTGIFLLKQNGTTTTDTVSSTGTYNVNGSAVTFTLQSDGSQTIGTINGNTMTAAIAGFVQGQSFLAIYKKQ